MWQDDAACIGKGELFYLDEGERLSQAQVKIDAAKALCADCPVAAPCARDGRKEHFGIWGGTTEGQRAKERNAARAPRPRSGR